MFWFPSTPSLQNAFPILLPLDVALWRTVHFERDGNGRAPDHSAEELDGEDESSSGTGTIGSFCLYKLSAYVYCLHHLYMSMSVCAHVHVFLSYQTVSTSLLCYLMLLVTFCLALLCLDLVMRCDVISCLVLSCLVFSCLVCPVLSCLVLSCLGLSRLVWSGLD